MHTVTFLLVCAVCMGHGHRLKMRQANQADDTADSPAKALAELLRALSPEGGFSISGVSAGRQISTESPMAAAKQEMAKGLNVADDVAMPLSGAVGADMSLNAAARHEWQVPAKTLLAAGDKFVQLIGDASTKLSSGSRRGDVTMATGTATATFEPVAEEVSEENPLRVIIAGAGVGGLALANSLCHDPKMKVTVLERTAAFKRFGGPIQLASNALEVLKNMDGVVFQKIMDKFTLTGDKMNGIKDGIRDEWYAKFDLATPAEQRNLTYTGVIERPDLQEIYLDALPEGVLQNGDGIERFEANPNGHGVKAITESGKVVEGDVIIGADGIWSAVRACMRDEPSKGDGSGCSYSGYTVFAGELDYDSFDNGEVGYKVYIGPKQYFVITDIGNGRYQWYAFLGRDPGSAETEFKPDGNVKFLKAIFDGWSKDIHHILDATKEHEVEQRDLYDRPPSVMKPWTQGNVALLGDAIHAMMPNLGQGGGQAIEDAYVLVQELQSVKDRKQIPDKLTEYRDRRLVRSASVQGLSRLASDIIVQGFDTPAKIVTEGGLKFENFNYAGIVTKLLQPILPLFFTVQFNFLYDGWANKDKFDLKAGIAFALLGGAVLLIASGALEGAELGLGFGLEGLLDFEGFEGLEGVSQAFNDFVEGLR